jgi:uncharacterized protein (DUF1778 family)
MSTKLERLQIRVQPEEKRRLEAAAAAAHLSVSAFVLAAAEVRAEEMIAERQVIALSPEGSRVLTEALERPARANERLASAMGRPSKFSWID